MRSNRLVALAAAALMLPAAYSFAQSAAPAAAAARPANATGMCKDGSYTDHATKSGACSGHKGVKEWYATAAAAPAAAAATKAPAAPAVAPAHAPAAATAATPATKAEPAATATAVSPPPAKPAATVAKPAAPAAVAPTPAAIAAAGAAAQVWVNTDSKVYHCAGTKYYGKTKKGEFMTEAAAKAAGNHADHGKACAAS